MYLIPIHVPIYVSGNTHLLATDWKRSLELLRDSLQDRYCDIVVVAPRLSAARETDQALEVVSPSEGIITVPSFPFDTRARQYWLRYRAQWRRHVDWFAAKASVVHSGFDDCYRPMSWLGFQLGVRHNKPTVFVQDVDHVGAIESRLKAERWSRRPERFLYKSLYERRCRAGVAAASLSLLKGGALMQRYGEHAKNPHCFHDTSYLSSEIVPAEVVTARHWRCHFGFTLRLVYCGRLDEGKGVADSITAIHQARQRGAMVSLDIIGDGPDRDALKSKVETLGVWQHVRFHGQRPYGPELLRLLAEYDALLFTSKREDTPRMIFDGYAAGLPVVGYAIPYLLERAKEENAAVLTPRDDIEALTQTLCRLDKDRAALVNLAPNVSTAAKYHAADIWYKRRAELTFEAVENHHKASV